MRVNRFLKISLFLFCLLTLVSSAHALADTAPAVSYIANPHAQSPTVIHTQEVKGKRYLFLPSSADLSALRLTFSEGGEAFALSAEGVKERRMEVKSGAPFDLLSLFPDGPVEDAYPVSLSFGGDESSGNFSFLIMRSENLASMYISSDDPVRFGRLWLDNNEDVNHERETTGHMALLRPDGIPLYDGAFSQLRGRGNTTWFWSAKKPYQIKLDYKADLLGSGNPDNRNRTWLLLAEAFDATLLHNTVTLHLGQEMGLSSTPELQPVDLYYDGEYRGHYLVCEKVQVNPGRLDILDYGEYVEKLYQRLTDIEALPTVEAKNQYGNAYQYVQDIQAQLGPRGAYLLELDVYNYLQRKSWVSTSGGLFYQVRSPEYLSQADAEYLSCLLQELEDTLSNHGVHPLSGKTVEDYLDLPSIARFFLVNQFAKTCDFWYTSTYFYIPEGESKLYGGPLWDFDIAYAMRDTRPHEGGVDGYVPENGWLRDLMTLPIFQEMVQDCYQRELLPILESILLKDTEARGNVLLSLPKYLARIEASRKMNYRLWDLGGGYNNINRETLYPTYEENVGYFRNYLIERSQWMANDLTEWSGHEIKNVNLTLSYANASVTEHSIVSVNNPYANAVIDDLQWNAEVDESTPYHTLYTATLMLKAQPNSDFAELPTVFVNGYPAEVVSHDSEQVCLRYRFIGPTFAPAIYDDVDYALLYNYHYFLAQNPEVEEECGNDPGDVLEYYVHYGISSGMPAIETFDADTFITRYEKLLDSYYMCDVEMSTLHYLENCLADGLLGMEAVISPPPAQ